MSSFYISDMATADDVMVGEVAVLVLGGELDYAASPRLKGAIASLLNAGHLRIALDLSDVNFIDSTAIGVLVGAAGHLHEAGGASLAVICTHPKVLQIFEITGLDRLLVLYDSREQAVSALAPVG